MAERFLIFGHRGSPNRQPENTMASFEEAVRSGADGFETDLRLLSDGVAVLYHDDELGVPAHDRGKTLMRPPVRAPTTFHTRSDNKNASARSARSTSGRARPRGTSSAPMTRNGMARARLASTRMKTARGSGLIWSPSEGRA